MKRGTARVFARGLVAFLLAGGVPAWADAQTALREVTLRHLSAAGMRDVYEALNPLFAHAWKARTGESVTIDMTHDASGHAAASVLDGREVDVVTADDPRDLDRLARAGLVAHDRSDARGVSPFRSTLVFVVRPGNPARVRDWSDLARPGMRVSMPHPRSTGEGRHAYLTAWAYALRPLGGHEGRARAFVRTILGNARLLDARGPDAITAFLEDDRDVLVVSAHEAHALARTRGAPAFDRVRPSLSLLGETPVVVVDRVAERRGVHRLARAYVEFLHSRPAQEIATRYGLRVPNAEADRRATRDERTIETFDVRTVFGRWSRVRETHFDAGGTFEALYSARVAEARP